LRPESNSSRIAYWKCQIRRFEHRAEAHPARRWIRQLSRRGRSVPAFWAEPEQSRPDLDRRYGAQEPIAPVLVCRLSESEFQVSALAVTPAAEAVRSARRPAPSAEGSQALGIESRVFPEEGAECMLFQPEVAGFRWAALPA
jgi:hypothetical protein